VNSDQRALQARLRAVKSAEKRVRKLFVRERSSSERTQLMRSLKTLLLEKWDLQQQITISREQTPAPAHTAFRIIALILPRRLYLEDLGDALEEIALLEQAKAPRWQIRLKSVSTHFWLLLNALREVVSVIKGLTHSRQ
jgi:hypothetical protein